MAKGGYRGGMPMGGMNQMQMMKQAQKMQENLMKMQEELQAKEATGRTRRRGKVETPAGNTGFTGRRVGTFQSTMGSYTTGFEESPSVGCADTVSTGRL